MVIGSSSSGVRRRGHLVTLNVRTFFAPPSSGVAVATLRARTTFFAIFEFTLAVAVYEIPATPLLTSRKHLGNHCERNVANH